MAYLTVALMKQYFRTNLLVKLSVDDETVDPNDPDNVDDDIVQLYIDDATNTVANFLRDIYTDVEPGDTPSSEIETLAARLAWCGLWTRTGQEPSQVSAMRDKCYETLHKLAVPTSDQKRSASNLSKLSTTNRQ